MKTKKIPFDINKAQAGAKVITRDGRLVKRLFYDTENENNDHPILAYVQEENGLTTYGFTKNGTRSIHEELESPDDLFIEEEIKPRRMTYREVSQWLRERPDEFRECKNAHNSVISSIASYREDETNIPVPEYIVIRRNYGKWKKPIIEK